MRSNILALLLLTLAACESQAPLLEPSFKKTLADPGACVDTAPPRLPIPLKNPAAAGFSDGNIYVFGGTRADTNVASRSIYRYSPAGGATVEIATLPTDDFVYAHAVASRDRIFVTTGRRVWVFDPILATIEPLSDAPIAFYLGTAATEGGLAVFGDDNTLASFSFDNRNWATLSPHRPGGPEVSMAGAGLPNFDLLELTPTRFMVRHQAHSGPTWIALPPPHFHHAGFSVIQVDDRFLRVGGWRPTDSAFAADDVVEAYDITTGEWTLGPSLARQMQDVGLAQSCGNRVYVFGSGDHDKPFEAAEYTRVVRYDPDQAEWKVGQ